MSRPDDDGSSDIVEVNADGAPVALKSNMVSATHADTSSQAKSDRSLDTGETRVTPSDVEPAKLINPEDGRKSTKESEVEEPSRVEILQSQIKALIELQSKVAMLRSLPAHLIILHRQSPLITFDLDSLLNPEASAPPTMKSHDMGSQAKSAFRLINEARNEMLKGTLQTALNSALQKQRDDRTGLLAFSRKTRKKRTTVAADSPAAFGGFEQPKRLHFPPPLTSQPEMRSFDALVAFVKQFNLSPIITGSNRASTKSTLSIWLRARPLEPLNLNVSDPLIVRACIRDVMTVFIKLRHPYDHSDGGVLRVESAVALGPREKKTASSHSDFIVYQKLSQYMSRMIELEPKVTVAQFLELVRSYEGLFVTPCVACARVLSQDKHIPPIARVWARATSNGEVGKWEARHVSCMQN